MVKTQAATTSNFALIKKKKIPKNVDHKVRILMSGYSSESSFIVLDYFYFSSVLCCILLAFFLMHHHGEVDCIFGSPGDSLF